MSGADELRSLGAALKGADKALRKEIQTALKATVAPLADAVKAEGGSTLPSRGGLAAKVEATRITTKIRMTGRQAGVRIVGKGKLEIEPLDVGVLRHPLFGNEKFWFQQSVRPGWWSRPIEERADTIRADLAQAIGDALKRVVAE